MAALAFWCGQVHLHPQAAVSASLQCYVCVEQSSSRFFPQRSRGITLSTSGNIPTLPVGLLLLPQYLESLVGDRAGA